MLDQRFLLLRYRISFVASMLLGVLLASASSVFAFQTASFRGAWISVVLWVSCAWYFSSFRWQLTAAGVLERSKPAPAEAATRGTWLVLVCMLALTSWLLHALGWLSGQNVVFIFLIFGSATLLLTAGLLQIVRQGRSEKRTPKDIPVEDSDR